MSLLAYVTQVNGNANDAPTLNAEIAKLFNALNSTSTDRHLVTRFSGADPVYSFDQLGAGAIVEWLKNGGAVARINNTGQFQSLLAPGTAPFVIASQTLVANLNAERLGGLLAASFSRLDQAALQTHVGDLEIEKESPAFFLEDLSASRRAALQLVDNTLNLVDVTGGTNPISIDLTNDVATFAQIPVGPNASPTTDNQLARKKYIDDNFLNKVTGDQSVAGIITFSQIPQLPGSNPDSANDAVRKAYVDGDLIPTTITIGGGTTIKKIQAGSVNLNPGSFNANNVIDVDITITGAEPGDFVIVNLPPGIGATFFIQSSRIVSSNTCRVVLANSGSASADPAAGDWTWLWVDLT